MRKHNSEIVHTLLKVIHSLQELDKRTSNYGTDKTLSYGEIHMIDKIRDYQGLHISAIAKRIGVTRGAVSQMVKKLEKKGMVVKEPCPDNLSRISIRLTEKGKRAATEHEKYHRNFSEKVTSILGSYSKEDQEKIAEFLRGLLEVINQI